MYFKYFATNVKQVLAIIRRIDKNAIRLSSIFSSDTRYILVMLGTF